MQQLPPEESPPQSQARRTALAERPQFQGSFDDPHLDALRVLNDRLANEPHSALPSVAFAQRLVIENREAAEDRRHRRWMEKASLLAKVGLAGGALVIGTALVLLQHTIPGLFVIGAGLYPLAPEYVMLLANRWRGGQEHED